MKAYEGLAAAFADEGVTHVFTLLGDGNMWWSSALSSQGSVTQIHARHENMAVAMADGYARLTGQIGVCSVTYGPGITQVPTSLVGAVRMHTPIVLFVGETPTRGGYHLQQFEQEALIRATGAEFVRVRHLERLADDVRRAFYLARTASVPVVLSVPTDLQEATVEDWCYAPSSALLPAAQRPACDPDLLDRAVEILSGARRPLIIAGAGACNHEARTSIIELAENTGALLGETLQARNLFANHPNRIGLVGGFSPPAVKQLVAMADVVVAIGARAGHYTTEGGRLFPQANFIHIDRSPQGLSEHVALAGLHLQADAARAAQGLVNLLPQKTADWNVADAASALTSGYPDPSFPLEPGTLDPRHLMADVAKFIHEGVVVVVGYGHFWHFVVQHVEPTHPTNGLYTAIGFGAVGQGLGGAIGAAVARPDQRILLLDGDGGAMMNIQEFETIARHNLSVCICVLNDGAYGSEIHRFKAAQVAHEESVFGRPDFASIAAGFGLRGHTVNAGQPDVAGPLSEFLEDGKPTVIDLHVSNTVPSWMFRAAFPQLG